MALIYLSLFEMRDIFLAAHKWSAKSAELFSRLGGLSIMGFGASFKPLESDRAILRKLFIFLEDRRVFRSRVVYAGNDAIVESVQKIRGALTNALQDIGETSNARGSLQAMRQACRSFLNVPNESPEKLVALGQFQTTFGFHVTCLAALYSLKIDENLKHLLPPPLPEERD